MRIARADWRQAVEPLTANGHRALSHFAQLAVEKLAIFEHIELKAFVGWQRPASSSKA